MASPTSDSSTLATASIATVTSVGTGVTAFLNGNAGAISVLIGFASLLVALLFYILNYRLRSRAQSMYRDEILQEVIEQLKAEAYAQDLDVGKLADAAAVVKRRKKPPSID